MVKLYKGERRKIAIDIDSKNGEDFIINKAEYEIYMNDNEQCTLIASGECDVENNNVCSLIEFDEVGFYQVKFIMTISNEVIIKKVFVTVQG